MRGYLFFSEKSHQKRGDGRRVEQENAGAVQSTSVLGIEQQKSWTKGSYPDTNSHAWANLSAAPLCQDRTSHSKCTGCYRENGWKMTWRSVISLPLFSTLDQHLESHITRVGSNLFASSSAQIAHRIHLPVVTSQMLSQYRHQTERVGAARKPSSVCQRSPGIERNASPSFWVTMRAELGAMRAICDMVLLTLLLDIASASGRCRNMLLIVLLAMRCSRASIPSTDSSTLPRSETLLAGTARGWCRAGLQFAGWGFVVGTSEAGFL